MKSLFVLCTALLFIPSAADLTWELQIITDDDGAIQSLNPVGNLTLNPGFEEEDVDDRKVSGMPLFLSSEGHNGYMMELYDANFQYCDSFLNFSPGVNTWSKFSKAFWYLMALFYVFLGVAIVADVFMASIEVITAQEVEVSRVFRHPETGEERPLTITVKFWNETVANLTLLALGSSAPEILLATMETVGTLGEPAGELGPATIVGSASFNLFMISAICLLSVPDGEERKISRIGVFGITAVSSVFAYFWMLCCIVFITPEQIDLWEAFLTFLFFPLLVGVAYGVDAGLFLSQEKMDEKMKDTDTIEDKVSNHLRDNDNIDAADVADQVNKELLGRKSPLWWRINGARFLSGKSPLVKNVKDIDMLRDSKVDDADSAHKRDNTFSTSYQPSEAMKTDTAFRWEIPQYSVREDEGKLTLRIMREGDTSGADKVTFETVNGSANAGTIDGGDYEYKTGVLAFAPGESSKELDITIWHDDEVEDDEFFCVCLTEPGPIDHTSRTVGLQDPKMASVQIIDVSNPGVLAFTDTVHSISERIGELRIPVIRKEGATDRITVDFETRPGTALEGVHYYGVRGTLTFENNESKKFITVKVINNKSFEDKTRNFNVMLKHATNKARIDPAKDTLTIGITNDQQYSSVVRQVFNLIGSGHDLSTHTWRQQFIDAMTFQSESKVAMTMHALTFPWKILFACLPPTNYYGGWATFSASLAAVGAVTFVVGELAGTWGCMVGLSDAQVALSIVALGTSMPDTFASIAATKYAPDADAAIGNITGSNSVNVFLGLGLPWVIATLYHAFKGTTYEQPQGTLSVAVAVFVPLAVICLGTLTVREFSICGNVGALGGSKGSRQLLAAFFASFWLIFLAVAFVS